MNGLDEKVRDAMLTVKESGRGVRAEILAFLSRSPYAAPSEILEHVQDATGTSSSNFYNNLETLRDEELVTRISGDGRATMYVLTDLGEDVVDTLGIGDSQRHDSESQVSDTADIDEEINSFLNTHNITAQELIARLQNRAETGKKSTNE